MVPVSFALLELGAELPPKRIRPMVVNNVIKPVMILSSFTSAAFLCYDCLKVESPSSTFSVCTIFFQVAFHQRSLSAQIFLRSKHL